MVGIANLTVGQFQARIHRFNHKYVIDWNEWLNTFPDDIAEEFGTILRKWQACRPNKMRRVRAEQEHDPPYLENLILQATKHLRLLQDFDIRDAECFTQENQSSLIHLWNIFAQLSYQGRARNGLAGAVGISKAVLLLTVGRVGPAFDSNVRAHLGFKKIDNPSQWIEALRKVSKDIQAFEANNRITMQEAVPRDYIGIKNGRIYDMALGPGNS